MMIDKVAFIKAMSCIRTEFQRQEELYKKLEDSFIDIEKVFEFISLDTMVDILTKICNISDKWLWIYIYELNWGERDGYAVTKSGRRLPLKTYDDLYEILTYQSPWDLTFKINAF